MRKKERFKAFVDYFSQHHPNPTTELHYETPFQLLLAVILSAQCTDKRVNQVTPALFKRYPDPESLAAASPAEVLTYIRSVSYPNNKSRYLVGAAKMLVNNFHGVLPAQPKLLQTMPGVGRKTAHVIASIIYKVPSMAVDTHVFRVSNRLGLSTNARTPLAVERQLIKYLPTAVIPFAHHWLILHGRYVCLARNPKCTICKISFFCKFYEKRIVAGI